MHRLARRVPGSWSDVVSVLWEVMIACLPKGSRLRSAAAAAAVLEVVEALAASKRREIGWIA